MVKSLLKKLGFIKKKRKFIKIKVMKPVYYGLCAPQITVREFEVNTLKDYLHIESYLRSCKYSNCKAKVIAEYEKL